MDRKRQGKVAAAMLAAALGLAACSGADGDAKDQGKPTEAASLDPQAQWADRMCAAVVQTSVTLTPPAIDEGDVGATLDALVAMFDTMAGQLDAQHAKLSEVGPPPSSGDRAFRTAMSHLEEAQRVARRVERSLSRSATAPPADLRRAFARAGGLEVDGADYPGFVLDLVGQNRDLLPSIAQAPTCATLTTS